ncbi:MAG: hypothetical protein OSJ74_10760, partial [Clostridia bacterium]|nr:hypothetical protein [Clostridia bacterium]
MNDKLLVIGGNTAEIKKLLLKLFTAEAESAQSALADNSAFICVADGHADMQEELKEIVKVYDYFVKRYEEIGNKITFDLNLKNRTLQKVDSVLLVLQKTIRLYQN